jgi:hypothetical protein
MTRLPRSRISIAMLACLGVIGAAARLVAQTPLRLGAELQVNTYTPGRQYAPAIGIDADGDFVVVWESQHLSATGR